MRRRHHDHRQNRHDRHHDHRQNHHDRHHDHDHDHRHHDRRHHDYHVQEVEMAQDLQFQIRLNVHLGSLQAREFCRVHGKLQV